MKLEDCTKDELIHFIKRNCLYSNDRLEFDVLMFRSERIMQKSAHEGRCAVKALGDYIAIMKPYDGKPIRDIPDNVIKRASGHLKRHESHSMAAARYERQYSKLQKQIDKNLGINGSG